jgi:hypothetical protein
MSTTAISACPGALGRTRHNDSFLSLFAIFSDLTDFLGRLISCSDHGIDKKQPPPFSLQEKRK